ncbi:radical SAM protein [Neobacillus drentensis]|uniref:radical SAM protein n=1 Tax=Neobacillus drentensis TaxID=220684 RepID=UPI000824690F|nr:radical SAM protein [Neobacillus drentensis]
MYTTITRENINEIPNSSFRSYVTRYLNIEDRTNRTIESLGLPFNKEGSRITKEEVIKEGVVSRNGKKSLYLNWISTACQACRTGEKSLTSFISFKCHKECYFCFNPNQENYSTFRIKDNDPIADLNQRLQHGEKFDHIALTGGEPLLHAKKVVEFFQFVEEKLKNTYTRLYTAGDLLTPEILSSLKEAHLNEIRFSIKQEETMEQMAQLFQLMQLAKEYIPFVVVEMPIIPGTLEQMKSILHTLDEIGVNGINLLEFCFPMSNAEAFEERGFDLKFPPFETYYNYWYAGGLAVHKSEVECLELLKYASEQSLKLGVHYCSLENKHTGQLYQQNKNVRLSKHYSFSDKDFFIKSAKVFGDDKSVVLKELKKQGQTNFELDEDHDSLQFPITSMKYLKDTTLDIAICSYVAEMRGNEEVLREVKVEWTCLK